MQYLGEFLSPNNSISQDQDKLTKYFYFRPDKYENPDADIENIFIIKGMNEFPKRLDLLAENSAYAIESIEVSKRVSDEETGVKNVSYVVTATYDLLENISKRENSGGGGSPSAEAESSSSVDINGNKVTADTKPWEMRGKWSFKPIETVVPFLAGYNVPLNATEWGDNEKTVNVVNKAGTRILAETKRYQLEITYQKNYQYSQDTWENMLGCYINSDEFNCAYDYRGAFQPMTLLILPPTNSIEFYEETYTENGVEKKRWTPYFSYTVTMIYDPQKHVKKLLNVGTMAKFGGPLPFEQIYQVTVTNESGTILDGYPKYTSASDALREHQMQSKSGNVVSVEAVSEPLPLTATGGIDYAAMRDPLNNPYVTLPFIEYPGRKFSTLPFVL